jgi:riboflavin kinase/FMN adenylyltransferase
MYKFWGKVRKHNQRGKKLGFPTANINLRKNIPAGIYISRVKIGKLIYSALTFIGKAETFNEKSFQAETYILDFKKNIYKRSLKSELTNSLYGQWLSIRLLKKIRDNKKFDSADDLIAQMKKDEALAREYLAS